MKKQRNNENKPAGGQYWLYGIHPVKMALANPDRGFLKILATQNSLAKIESSMGKEIRRLLSVVKLEEIEKVVGREGVHQGVAALVAPLEEWSVRNFMDDFGKKDRSVIVAFDQVSDPHNIGAVIRTAAAFGADAVLLTERGSPQQTAVLAKSSAGAIEVVKIIRETNLTQAIMKLKENGYFCAGLAGEGGTDLREFKAPEKLVLVLGSEGEGLRRLTAEQCDWIIRIPIADKMESLNVSNAAAVALFAIGGA